MDKKYKIEGNIDFFSELYKSLDEDENDDDNNCLITNQKLTDRFVKLNCGHSFNYLPLLNDIKNHKEKFNNLEGSHTKLKQDEIRCPYCRNRQTDLLPYYEDLYPDKINGVNCIMPFLNYPNYSTYKPPNSIYGNCCYKVDFNNYYCVSKNVYNFEDGKTYCYTHSKVMTLKILKDAELKKKESAKLAKLKEKEDKKLAKLKEKEDIKLAKLKEKEEKKKNKKNTVTVINLLDEENEIVENEIICEVIDLIQTDLGGCIEILKSGSNKGNKCCKGIYNNNLCKRHFDKKLNK
jgi:hypothetical protein